jgi:hypothetical protein
MLQLQEEGSKIYSPSAVKNSPRYSGNYIQLNQKLIWIPEMADLVVIFVPGVEGWQTPEAHGVHLLCLHRSLEGPRLIRGWAMRNPAPVFADFFSPFSPMLVRFTFISDFLYSRDIQIFFV